jgi:hypothetical protein
MSKYYDIELIDVNENVDNFHFEKINNKDLEDIVNCFKDNRDYLEFTSNQGKVVLERKYFRGVMYQDYREKRKTVAQETMENAEEIAKVQIRKTNKKVNYKG